ncbi:hypothetical protein [Streptomyces sp. FH025]|uniref:hypothetical protein n=1 Tax=Streptomyces sp. FH025 TaxID=2815937 RepID=UPI001A9E72B9|nr:hypothetical protein [Streptomyces sp. FH025]MBO1414188.1 hypothetical protein [Streptomyces sp. FH025]
MRFTRTRKRIAAAAIAAAAMGAIGIGSATSAQATETVEGSWRFGTGGCEAVENITLWSGGHDWMNIVPTANPGHCLFGVFDRNAWKWLGAAGATPSSDPSPWYYDGPGQSLEACLIDTANNNTWACGPIN